MYYKFGEIYLKEELGEKQIIVYFGKHNEEKRKEIHIWLAIQIQYHL